MNWSIVTIFVTLGILVLIFLDTLSYRKAIRRVCETLTSDWQKAEDLQEKAQTRGARFYTIMSRLEDEELIECHVIFLPETSVQKREYRIRGLVV